MTNYIARSEDDGYHIEVNTENPRLYQLVQNLVRVVMDSEEVMSDAEPE